MNVYRIYIVIVDLFNFTPLLMIDKKGETDFEFILSLYIHIWVFTYIEFMHLLFYKMGKWFWKLKQKGEEGFWKKELLIYVFSLTLLMHIYLFSFMYFIEYLIVYYYTWVKEELLWSLTLIHAYITPWVLSSWKRGEIVGPKVHHSSFDDD